jgi:hypothetical protein
MSIGLISHLRIGLRLCEFVSRKQEWTPGLAAKNVGVASADGVHNTVQSGGFMADGTDERMYVRNMPSCSANVKWQIEL